ncbi:unnamed protein product (macronuclear) [Paramecium tetraurelia]|uniref:Uncharacterized protein n=1 Tax=Paramecium tetraurelia TaxID=5888 RepID=A0DZT8_PARTE|nr:uncharacterized protein GSPATT00021723001 [Paramecium tetraurelia]CAK88555.1 unnamed protein product [Paramecium tetraurelia]|eukprot:XP_001455952.1 hypothetical protein (macronuclear) [Paramecium tetraurelia strain d4-2]
MITNTNGVAYNIYHFLWFKDESLLKESFQIRIPDTLIYKNGVPQVWYFTSKEGEIMTKKSEARKSENLIKHFCSGDKPNGQVIAYYIYPQKYNHSDPKEEKTFPSQSKKAKPLLDFDEKICIYYLTKQMFPDFVNSPNKPPSGILQKFIEPLGNHESLIQAIWSPSVCILSKKQNNRDLYDMAYDPYERCTTFDGGEAYSRVIPLRGKEISQEIRKQCQMIVQKITNLSYGQTNLSRIVFYFKADQNNKVWFLYSSSIRIQGEAQSQIKLYQPLWGNVNVKKNNTPIPFNTNFQKPYSIKNMLTVNTMHPVALIKDIECFECGVLCQQKDLYHLTYEYIIKHFDQDVNQHPLVNNIEIIKPKSFLQCEGHLRDIHSHIPPLILKLYPHLTVQIFEQLKVNDAFLIKSVLICESCFLKYSESDPGISGAKLRVSKQLRRIVKQQPSKSILNRRPDLKEFLIETNLELLKYKNAHSISQPKEVQSSSHATTSFLHSFQNVTQSTNMGRSPSLKQFRNPTEPGYIRLHTAK